MTIKKYFAIGYVPLLWPDELAQKARVLLDHTGTFLAPTDDVLSRVAEVLTSFQEQSIVFGCAWAMGPKGTVEPILIVDDPNALYHHLYVWSEEAPSDWFTFHFAHNEYGYQLVLNPIMEKMTARRKRAIQLAGEDIPESAVIEIVYQPLTFFAPDARNVAKFRTLLPNDEIRIGLIDVKKCGEMSGSNIEMPQSSIWMGPFRRGPNKIAKDLLLENTKQG